MRKDEDDSPLLVGLNLPLVGKVTVGGGLTMASISLKAAMSVALTWVTLVAYLSSCTILSLIFILVADSSSADVHSNMTRSFYLNWYIIFQWTELCSETSPTCVCLQYGVFDQRWSLIIFCLVTSDQALAFVNCPCYSPFLSSELLSVLFFLAKLM